MRDVLAGDERIDALFRDAQKLGELGDSENMRKLV
jgi:hypothetical protein